MKKVKRYNIKLNENQMNTIYSISYNKEKQNRLMSVLQYCIKYTDATTGLLTKTIGRLFTMYSVNNFEYHDKISRKYFYTLINLLIDHKLICVRKIVHKKVHKINVAETIENTNVEPVFEKTNNPMSNAILNTYTPYIETRSIKALDLVGEVFKDLKVKSKIIKSMVIAKLQNTVLDAAGAIKYIIKVITEKTEQYNLMRVKYAQMVAKTKYSKKKNTFVGPVKTKNFSNFEPRKICSDKKAMKDIEDKLTAPKEEKEVDIQGLLNQYRS